MRKNEPNETAILVTLPNGRNAWRDSHGRHRDQLTGQWISARTIADLSTPRPSVSIPAPAPAPIQHTAKPLPQANSASARDRARWHLQEAVRLDGLDPMTVEDAWGRLVGVQARIALDESGGTRATAAAKLVAQATGLMDTVKSETDADQPIRIEMTVEDALAFMDLIHELDQPEDPALPASPEDPA